MEKCRGRATTFIGGMREWKNLVVDAARSVYPSVARVCVRPVKRAAISNTLPPYRESRVSPVYVRVYDGNPYLDNVIRNAACLIDHVPSRITREMQTRRCARLSLSFPLLPEIYPRLSNGFLPETEERDRSMNYAFARAARDKNDYS